MAINPKQRVANRKRLICYLFLSKYLTYDWRYLTDLINGESDRNPVYMELGRLKSQTINHTWRYENG